MAHRTVREWGNVPVGEVGFAPAQANALLTAARAHPCARNEGTNILIDRHDRLVAQQVVGMAGGTERLSIATIDVAQTPAEVERRLAALCGTIPKMDGIAA